MSLGIIPQIFYDIIARVVPGCVLGFMWYITILGPIKAVNPSVNFLNKDTFNFWTFALLTLLSYVLGTVLTDLWSFTFGKIMNKKVEKEKENYLKACIAEDAKIRSCLSEPDLKLETDNFPSVYAMHDHLQVHSLSEAYRFLKLRA